MRAFNYQTADQAWLGLAEELANHSDVISQTGRGGPTRELLHVGFSIAEPRQRWAISRSPALNPAFAIAEVVWILAGRNDAAFLNYFNSRLPHFAGATLIYPGAYGHRLRKHFGHDQLEAAFFALSECKDSRQVVLQIWDSIVDFPNVDGSATSSDIPCNICSMLKVRNGRLEWTQVMRSNDIFRGLPHNIVQFTAIQEVIAGWLGLELGTYCHHADSLHVYEPNIANISDTRSVAELRNLDDLRFPKPESDYAFRRLEQLTELIVSDSLSEQELVALVEHCELSNAHKNMFCILTAESGRRRNFPTLVSVALETCTSELYVALFDRWCVRMNRPMIQRA